MPRSEERGGMAARSEAEINSLLVYKSPARKGGVLYYHLFKLLFACELARRKWRGLIPDVPDGVLDRHSAV